MYLRPHISKSSIETFDFCQVKYFLQYVLGYRDKPIKSAIIGIAVHEFAELIALCTLNAKNNKLSTSSDYYFFSHETIEKLDIEAIYKYVWLSTLPKYPNLTLADEKLFIKLCNSLIKQFDIRNYNIVGIEKEFDIELKYDWAILENGSFFRVKGILDLIIKHDNGIYEVIDYKTGKRHNFVTGKKLEYSDIQTDLQLSIYDLAFKQLYPGIKSSYTLFYIKNKEFVTVSFPEKNLKRIESVLKRYKERIQKVNKLIPLSIDRASWKCQRLCGFSKSNEISQSSTCDCEFVQSSIKNSKLDWVQDNLKKQEI